MPTKDQIFGEGDERREDEMEHLLMRRMLESAGITINGHSPWDIRIKDERWFGRVWREKNLGLGESYMDGWWACERIDEMIFRLLSGDLEKKVKASWRDLMGALPAVFFNLQKKTRARIIADRHYDLDNRLFFSFLDPYRQYSCGFFKDTAELEQAQKNKMELICRKLQLAAGDRVLDIGCGWGGLARFMAERYGCTVTGVNISHEQLAFARDFCQGLPVTLLDCDYREIKGEFDKIVSVGMFEHVGYKNHRTFMQVVHRCLSDAGLFLLHTIGNDVSTLRCDPWISKYIFPNGLVPCLTQITRSSEGLFVIEDVHNIGSHYDPTLISWNRNFQNSWERLREGYDNRFKRMWEYYLLSCAGAFRARGMQVWQILMTRCGSGAIPGTAAREG
jgi:cyclopropane-fatty-acyl-phospholipid synthase